MSATLLNAGLFNAKHYGFSPIGGGAAPTYPTTHAIYFNTTSITLKWHNSGTHNLFELQVSLLPDFSVLIRDDATITDVSTTFTDSSTNDARRFWRWRGSSNSGTTWGRWSRVGSYWLNTSGAESVTIPRNTFILINPSPVTDRFLFEMFPFHKTVPAIQYRLRSRNRLGTLLSEYITIKDSIQLGFDETRWLRALEFSEARRFNETVKTCYLAIFHDYDPGEPVPNIWKVQFDSDPDLSMFVAGRQGMLIGNLTFTEV